MAVVKTLSNLFRDPLTLGAVPDALQVKGVRRCAVGTVSNAATDSSGSTYKLCSVPSHAIMHPDTVFDVENWGFAQVVIGSLTATDQIADQTKATENLVTPFAWGDANHGKRLWEVLGLAEDPGGIIDLYAHAEAAAVSAGSMPFAVEWIDSQ
ncbi:hypothetical protein P2H44_22685 [Albimonas sp. CAU 1670]|uniref:hypothetical protein n=1 Tax=Albimonas sp. CAU 1670 TaxID=3032599 RepID=UPI0023DA154F|nr:hypothetical protein [Albimonas sp. CAU 1670]MDF2235372.1 hypothetical protein [Albimonas sp. CAU 1670]